MNKRILICALLCMCAVITIALADTLTLKDGTKIDGRVIPQGDRYWVKLADGSTRYVDKDQVTNWTKGDAPNPTAGLPATPATPSSPTGSGQSFLTVKAKADAVDSPVFAVQQWEKFIDSKPSASDLALAKIELAKWQKLDADKAEKINGKWIGGDEKKALVKKVGEMIKEGYKAVETNQQIEGVNKLEEAMKLYPNSFEVNYLLGYFYLEKGAIGADGRGNIAYQEKAIKCLEIATKLEPLSAGAWSNLAVCYSFRSRYIDSVQCAYKAVKIEDSKPTVENLVSTIAFSPPGLRENNDKVKPIMEDAIQLAIKYQLNLQNARFVYIPPKPPKEGGITPTEVAADERKGPVWSGSGFFISPDGYFITNHHVATGDPEKPIQNNLTFRVRFDDKTEKTADLIAVDETTDEALMHVKMDKPVPYLKLATDNPHQAAKALVLGYPSTGDDNSVMQVSSGEVSSINLGEFYEVWYHLETTHGNSGGPIVDKDCRVIGILSAGKTVSENLTYVLAVGPNQIRNFLKALGDKAPKAEFIPPSTAAFDGESLTDQARKATLHVTAIRGDKHDVSAILSVHGAPTTQPKAATGTDEKPDAPKPKKGAKPRQ